MESWPAIIDAAIYAIILVVSMDLFQSRFIFFSRLIRHSSSTVIENEQQTYPISINFIEIILGRWMIIKFVVTSKINIDAY